MSFSLSHPCCCLQAGPSSSHAYSAVPSAEPFEVITVTPPQGPHITRTQKLFLRHIRRNSTVSTAGSAAQTPREASGLSEIQPVVDPSGGSFSVEVGSCHCTVYSISALH